MTFHPPTNGVPNPHGGTDIPPTDIVEAQVHQGPEPNENGGQWETPLFAMAQPGPSTWEDLRNLPIHGHGHHRHSHHRWRHIYVPNEGMTKGELAVRFRQAKSVLHSIDHVLATWYTTNSTQSSIKRATLAIIGSVLATCRHFSPSGLRAAMADLVHSLPEPFCSILGVVLGGGSADDKAGRFMKAINTLQRWQPDKKTMASRFRGVVKQYSASQIRSFIANNPLIMTAQFIQIASEVANIFC